MLLNVNFLWFYLTWIGLQCAIVVFPEVPFCMLISFSNIDLELEASYFSIDTKATYNCFPLFKDDFTKCYILGVMLASGVF